MINGSLMKIKSIAEFCNVFDLHKAIIGLENQFLVFLRVVLLHRFTVLYLCMFQWSSINELNKLKLLEELRMLANPLVKSTNPETFRQILIAKLKHLNVCNRTEVYRRYLILPPLPM